MNLDLRSTLFQQESYAHCEAEVHTVYQWLFFKADKGLHPMQHTPTYYFCMLVLSSFALVASLKVFE